MDLSKEWQDELLVKYLTGMADAREIEAAEAWIKQSDDNLKYFNELRKVYEAAKFYQQEHGYHPDLSWQRVRAQHYRNQSLSLKDKERDNRRYFVMQLMKYAAMIVLVSGLTVFGTKLFNRQEMPVDTSVWHTVEAPVGSRSNIILADGSNVWLNAGSVLKYSSSFGVNNREVFLEGEAFFNVTHDDQHRFVVKANDLDVVVTGTKFNVKAYPDEDYLQTTLVEGSVSLEGLLISATGQERIMMKPGQNAVIRPNAEMNAVLIDSDINTDVYTSWKDNRWIIDREELSSLAVKLERRYNIDIMIDTESLKNYRFTGIIKDETLEQVLNLIQLSAPIEYQILSNTVHLKADNTFKNEYDDMLIKGTEN